MAGQPDRNTGATPLRAGELAQLEGAGALGCLVGLAEVLCPAAWDAARDAGQAPDAWPASQVAGFIRDQVRTALQTARAEGMRDLAQAYHRQAQQLTEARDEGASRHAELQQMRAIARAALERAARLESVRPAGRVTPAGMARDAAPAAPTAAALRQLEAVPEERLDALIRLIATTGLARSDALRAQLAQSCGVSKASSRVGQVVRAALHRGLLEAHPCTVDWPGPKTRAFLLLTPLGRARAVTLGLVPVPDEYEPGLRQHKTPEHLYLVLRTADLLRAADYDEVDPLPACREVGDGTYCPDIVAREGGRWVCVECERSYNKARSAKWQRAGQANGGIIHLVAPNRRIMQAVLREIAITTGGEFKVWAFNISEHAAGQRGPGGSVWAYQG